MRTVLLRWAAAFKFITDADGWRRKLGLGGLYLLLCPPIGWLLALGYRKEVASRLVGGVDPTLPEWSKQTVTFLVDDVRAAGVILAYYIPFLILYWVLALDGLTNAREHTGQMLLFVVALPLLVPVSLPLLPLLYVRTFPWMHLSSRESVIVAALFFGTASVLPAAFVQVSMRGRFRDAFRLRSVFSFIAACPRAYVEAWLISLLATILALLCGPFAPWGIFWSYLVIVYAFNDALSRWNHPEVRVRFRESKLLPELHR